jgi:hypothetical protein
MRTQSSTRIMMTIIMKLVPLISATPFVERKLRRYSIFCSGRTPGCYFQQNKKLIASAGAASAVLNKGGYEIRWCEMTRT